MKPSSIATCLLGLSSLAFGCAMAGELTGQYLVTGNVAAEGSIGPSINSRLTANYAPAWTSGNMDFRIEQYVENSYHGINDSLVEERKFEAQANFNYPLSKNLSATVGVLRHTNSTFQDNYYWGIAGLVWNGEIATDTNLTTAVLAEKKGGGGRVFFDTSATLERRLQEKLVAFAAAHLYENLGEFDVEPTRKMEFEVGVNYSPTPRYTLGISYFNHRQVDDPTDRFSMIKLKAGINF